MKRKSGNRFDHLELDGLELHVEAEENRQATQGVLGSEPMHRHAYQERAVEAFQRGEFEQALRYFTRTLELDRQFVPAWVGQVQMLIELNELREADLWADKALEMFREHGDLLAAKAVARTRMKDHKGGMVCSDRAVASRGSSAYRWLARGEVLLARKQERAGACFDRAFLEPDATWFTRLWAARIYRHYGQSTPALVAARQACEHAPSAPYAWCVRGLCERDLAMGCYRASLQRALEIDPRFAPARAALREPVRTSRIRGLYRRMRGR